MKNPKADTTLSAENLRAGRGEDPDQAGADQPAATTNAMISRLNPTSSSLHEVVQPLVDEADFDLAVSHLLEDVVHLVRVLGEDPRELDRLAPRRAPSMRCGV